MATITTPTPADVDTPTAPLPLSAAAALARVERAFLPLNLVRAVIRYEVALARRDELAAKPASSWSPAEFDSSKAAHETIVESVLTLGAAGRLDLLAPAELAARYRQASAHCADLAARDDIDGCWAAQDEMRMCFCQLQSAGRLDLIGGE